RSASTSRRGTARSSRSRSSSPTRAPAPRCARSWTSARSATAYAATSRCVSPSARKCRTATPAPWPCCGRNEAPAAGAGPDRPPPHRVSGRQVNQEGEGGPPTISRMISLEVPRERALLVGAPDKTIEPGTAADHREELARLADTAGAVVVGTLQQRLDAPHPKYYIGEGKALELRERVLETDAGLVIFDEQLTPAQGKNLETLLGTRVMDRSELILDIFATRARTSEAKMQVELAQLEYLLPRLKRMWTH